jgi:hypothetical protein
MRSGYLFAFESLESALRDVTRRAGKARKAA